MERHQIIQNRENLWYSEPRREALLKELEALSTDPRRHRQQSIAIIAEANGGKSAIITRYLLRHPEVRGQDALVIPAICISMTTVNQPADFSTKLLEALHAPDADAGTHVVRMKRFMKLARAVQLRTIFLDEMHDCVGTSGRGRPFLREIKGIMNNGLGLCVVPVGTEDLAAVLALDTQLSSRFNFARGRLPRIPSAVVVKSMMLKISGLAEDQVSQAAVDYVFEETRGILGYTLDLIERTLIDHGNLTLASLRKTREQFDRLDTVV